MTSKTHPTGTELISELELQIAHITEQNINQADTIARLKEELAEANRGTVKAVNQSAYWLQRYLDEKDVIDKIANSYDNQSPAYELRELALKQIQKREQNERH
jgi:hypothetical protein